MELRRKIQIIAMGLILGVFAAKIRWFLKTKNQRILARVVKEMSFGDGNDYSSDEAKAKIRKFLAQFDESIPHHTAVLIAVNRSPALQYELFEKANKHFQNSPLLIAAKAQIFGDLSTDELDNLIEDNSSSAYPNLWKARFFVNNDRDQDAVIEIQKALEKPLLDQQNMYYAPLVSFYQHMGFDELESKLKTTGELNNIRVKQGFKLYEAFNPFIDQKTGEEVKTGISENRLKVALLFAKVLGKSQVLIDRIMSNGLEQRYWNHIRTTSIKSGFNIETELTRLKNEDICIQILTKAFDLPKLVEKMSSLELKNFLDHLNSNGEFKTSLNIEGVENALSQKGCRTALL